MNPGGGGDLRNYFDAAEKLAFAMCLLLDSKGRNAMDWANARERLDVFEQAAEVFEDVEKASKRFVMGAGRRPRQGRTCSKDAYDRGRTDGEDPCEIRLEGESS
jgi:hypothetical protein